MIPATRVKVSVLRGTYPSGWWGRHVIGLGFKATSRRGYNAGACARRGTGGRKESGDCTLEPDATLISFFSIASTATNLLRRPFSVRTQSTGTPKITWSLWRCLLRDGGRDCQCFFRYSWLAWMSRTYLLLLPPAATDRQGPFGPSLVNSQH